MEPWHRKYPRTPHLPWSPGVSADDLRDGASALEGRQIVVTEKLDGENTTLYRDHVHARSLDSRHHPSRAWVKRLHHQVAPHIPARWRVCGENLFARHAIAYDALPSYFVMFSIWDDADRCLSWDDTLEWAALLGLVSAPVLYRGAWDEGLLRGLALDTTRQEGYVVRDAGSFTLDDFSARVAKWVRANHVQTDTHWMHGPVVANGLAPDAQELP